MSFEFKKYPEIENSYRIVFLNKIHDLGYDDPSIKYVVSVKVDGANFCVSIDENNKIHYSKRTSELERGDTFYNWESAMQRDNVPEKVKQIKQLLHAVEVNVYGELAGGKYNHPDVPKENVSAVQARIQYAPFVFFYAFDISIVNAENRRYYLDENIFDEICKKVNLTRSIVVKTGTLQECLEYPNDFQDPVAQTLFGLPPIENNITEGVVIKPIIPIWLPNGSRLIIKNKNDKFKEKSCKTGKQPKNPERDLTELENKVFEWLDEYKTESRLYSVISKIGIVHTKDFGKIMKEFMTDLFEEFNKDHKKQIEELEEMYSVEEFTFSRVTKKFQKYVQEWIRPIFISILNEEKFR